MKKMSRPRVVRGKKTSIEIRPDLLRAAKHLAVDEGVGLREIVERALEAHVGKRKGTAPAARVGRTPTGS